MKHLLTSALVKVLNKLFTIIIIDNVHMKTGLSLGQPTTDLHTLEKEAQGLV